MADNASVDYDTVTKIQLSPSGLKETVGKLMGHSKAIAEGLDRVTQALNEIPGAVWVGPSQREANDFNAKWEAAAKELFGSREQPELGSLNVIVSGLNDAYENYQKAESGLADLWRKFRSNLAMDGDDTPSQTPPEDKLDPNVTAITADYPPFEK